MAGEKAAVGVAEVAVELAAGWGGEAAAVKEGATTEATAEAEAAAVAAARAVAAAAARAGVRVAVAAAPAVAAEPAACWPCGREAPPCCSSCPVRRAAALLQ